MLITYENRRICLYSSKTCLQKASTSKLRRYTPVNQDIDINR